MSDSNETVYGTEGWDSRPCASCGELEGKHRADDNRCPPKFRTRGRTDEWEDTFFFPVKTK